MNDQNEKKSVGIKTLALAATCVVSVYMITDGWIHNLISDKPGLIHQILSRGNEVVQAGKTDSNNFIYRGIDLKKLGIYRFQAWEGFTPSHYVFRENSGSIPAWKIDAVNKQGFLVTPDMSLYEIMNGEGHVPVANISKIYAVDLNGDGKIAGKPVSQLEKTTLEACMEQRARRDADFRRFVEQRSYGGKPQRR